jgi:hypothetical protein
MRSANVWDMTSWNCDTDTVPGTRSPGDHEQLTKDELNPDFQEVGC